LNIYKDYENKSHDFKKHAVCKIGCAFCCTDAGRVDVTTLEALIIRSCVDRMPEPVRKRVRKKIVENKRDKENNKHVPCPFLKDDETCLIYDVRPFICRQLYSVRECKNQGPTLHKAAADLAKRTIKEIQLLDDTGYSGHISYILFLLDRAQFRKLYLSGGFNPDAIQGFGKTHALVINRFIS